MYRYDNYTDSFVRIDGEPNTVSTTVRVGESVLVQKTELTDECVDRIADAVVRKLSANQTIDSYSYARGFADGSESMRNLFEQDEPSDDCQWK